MMLDHIAIIGDEPKYSPYGYLVTADGTIYTLTEQWVHGVLLALLFPEEAQEAGYDIPTKDDYNVFHYQRFELDHHEKFPVVRIAMGMLYRFNVSKGAGPATYEQVQAVSKILKEQDVSLNDIVQTDCRDMTARSMLKWLIAKEAYDLSDKVLKKPTKYLSRKYDD